MTGRNPHSTTVCCGFGGKVVSGLKAISLSPLNGTLALTPVLPELASVGALSARSRRTSNEGLSGMAGNHSAPRLRQRLAAKLIQDARSLHPRRLPSTTGTRAKRCAVGLPRRLPAIRFADGLAADEPAAEVFEREATIALCPRGGRGRCARRSADRRS